MGKIFLHMPTKLMLALALSLAVAVHAVKIVATFPAYDVVLKEAFPQAEVILLAGGVADPQIGRASCRERV